jgi:methionine synthase II (cobalamin-independent)
MIEKSAFSQDEWKAILTSPMLAGMAVTLSDPSGLWGTLKESLKNANALMEARKSDAANAIAKAIAAEFETSDGRGIARDSLKEALRGKKPAEAKQAALDGLAKVAEILNRKAPADADAFKAWLRSVAQSTAEASSEGGFLGIGGETISDAEKATLAEIEKALA